MLGNNATWVHVVAGLCSADNVVMGLFRCMRQSCRPRELYIIFSRYLHLIFSFSLILLCRITLHSLADAAFRDAGYPDAGCLCSPLST